MHTMSSTHYPSFILPRSLTPSHASLTRLCSVIPSLLGCAASLAVLKTSTGHLTPSCQQSMLLPEHLLRPLSNLNLKGAASFFYSAWHSKSPENRFSKHITHWIWRCCYRNRRALVGTLTASSSIYIAFYVTRDTSDLKGKMLHCLKE